MKNLSLALWTTSEELSNSNNGSPQRREVHFNVWNIKGKHALDIGVMLPRSFVETDNHLFLYFPFSCEIIDLCDVLIKDNYKSLLSIFNCFFGVSTCNESVRCCSAKIDGTTQICLTSFLPNEPEKINDGVIFKLTLQGHQHCENEKKCDNYYIRLRVSGDCIKNCYFHSKKETSRFQNFTDDVSFLDFRYNDRRILPDRVAQKIIDGHVIALDLVQFFYICPASYKIEQTKKEINNMRCLENHLWEGYFPDLTKMDKADVAIAYQRKTTPKEKAKLTDFSFLIKLSDQRFRVWKAIFLSLLACLVSFSISYFASACYDKLNVKRSYALESLQKETGQCDAYPNK